MTLGDAVKIAYADEAPSQYMLVYRGERSSGAQVVNVAFFLHGGFWKSHYGIDPPAASCCDGVIAGLRAACDWVVLVEYRRQPDDNPCSGYPYAGDDVARAYRHFLESDRIAGDAHVVVLGHSAGGTLALALAARLRADAYHIQPIHTFALAPVANLRMAAAMRLSQKGDAVQLYAHGEPGDFDNVADADGKDGKDNAYDNGCPTAIAHRLTETPLTLYRGSNDTDIPHAVVASCHDAIVSTAGQHAVGEQVVPRARFVQLADTDHYSIVGEESAGWLAVLRDVRAALASASASAPVSAEVQ